MYKYYVYLDSFTYTFNRETYFPIQEFDVICKRYLKGSMVEMELFVLESVLSNLGFELYEIIGESNSDYDSVVKDVHVSFSYKK